MKTIITLSTLIVGSLFAQAEPLKVDVNPKGKGFSFQPCVWHLETLLNKRNYFQIDLPEQSFDPAEAGKHYSYGKNLKSGLATVKIKKSESEAFSVFVDAPSNSKEAQAHKEQIVSEIVRVLRNYYGTDNVSLDQPIGPIASN